MSLQPLSDAEVEQALLVLGEEMKGRDFKAWQAAFVTGHMASFEFGVEENRLEHTEIHKSYMQGLEAQLASKLPTGLEMRALEESLQQPGIMHGLSDEAGQAVEILAQASDFVAFKDMILFEKAKHEDELPGQNEQAALVHGAGLLNVEEVLDSCAQLSLAAASDGWTTVLKNNWIHIDKKPVHPDRPIEIHLRGVWTMELSFLECCDMMINFSSQRSSWDKNFRGCDLLKGKSLVDNDIVVTSHIEFGTLLHAAGMPRTLTSRVVRRWGHPEENSVSFVMIPWDAEKDAFDANNPVLTQKVTTIKPHPSNEAKSVMTSIESNKLGRLPRWVLGTLMNVTAPQIMKGLEQRYIASARAGGTTQDWLPADFPAPRFYPKYAPRASTGPACWAGLVGRVPG